MKKPSRKNSWEILCEVGNSTIKRTDTNIRLITDSTIDLLWWIRRHNFTEDNTRICLRKSDMQYYVYSTHLIWDNRIEAGMAC